MQALRSGLRGRRSARNGAQKGHGGGPCGFRLNQTKGITHRRGAVGLVRLGEVVQGRPRALGREGRQSQVAHHSPEERQCAWGQMEGCSVNVRQHEIILGGVP